MTSHTHTHTLVVFRGPHGLLALVMCTGPWHFAREFLAAAGVADRLGTKQRKTRMHDAGS